MRSTNVRDTADFDVDRALVSTSLADRFLRAPIPARGHAGEHPLQHDPGERITISEVLIGRERAPRTRRQRSGPWAA